MERLCSSKKIQSKSCLVWQSQLSRLVDKSSAKISRRGDASSLLVGER